MGAFPECVQSRKLVSEMTERLAHVLNAESAQSILALKIAGPTPERRQELIDKSNEGRLIAEERAGYESYVQFCEMLAILQSKARSYLQQFPRA